MAVDPRHGGAPRGTAPRAKVRLVRGRSAIALWDAGGEEAGVRVDVGSSPSCAWCVEAPGVAPYQLAFYWDGEVLWAADIHTTKSVRVDNEPLDDWRALVGRCRIDFGQATLTVEAGPARQAGHAELTEEEPATIRRVGTRPLGWDDPSIPGAPTHIFDHGGALLSAETTRMERQPGERPAVPEPSVGPPSTGRPSAAPMSNAATVVASASAHDAASAPSDDPFATRMVALPDAAGTPRLGGDAATAANRSTSSGGSAPLLRPGSGVGGSVAPAETASAGESAPPALSGADGAPRDAAAPSPSRPRFRPPPSQPVALSSTKRTRHLADAVKLSLPLRTWVLVGITVAALVGVLFMGDGNRRVASHPSPAPKASPAQFPAPPSPAAVDGSGNATAAGAVDGRAQDDAGSNRAAPPSAQQASAHDDHHADADVTEERAAADLLMGGRQTEALAAYRALARAHPDRPVFATIVRVLTKRIGARCHDGVDAQGRPCR